MFFLEQHNKLLEGEGCHCNCPPVCLYKTGVGTHRPRITSLTSIIEEISKNHLVLRGDGFISFFIGYVFNRKHLCPIRYNTITPLIILCAAPLSPLYRVTKSPRHKSQILEYKNDARCMSWLDNCITSLSALLTSIYNIVNLYVVVKSKFSLSPSIGTVCSNHGGGHKASPRLTLKKRGDRCLSLTIPDRG